MTFGQRLEELVAARESQIVLGLDPDPARLWPEALDAAPAEGSAAQRAAAAVQAHCALLIDAAGAACVAVKPQLACFERLGAAGWAALAATVEHARAAGLLVIADGKRGDIDVSAAAYAQALVGTTPTPFGDAAGLGADAFTASPLLGVDALEPFVAGARAADAGIFVLVRTSNPGAADVEDLELAGGGRVWERLARIVTQLAGPGEGLSEIGAVVGATVPEHVARMRELMPRAPFLLPGIGAQGGRVEDLAPAFAAGRAGGLISASRSIARAHEQGGGAPARRRAPRGRAPAGSGVGACMMLGRGSRRRILTRCAAGAKDRPLDAARPPALAGGRRDADRVLGHAPRTGRPGRAQPGARGGAVQARDRAQRRHADRDRAPREPDGRRAAEAQPRRRPARAARRPDAEDQAVRRLLVACAALLAGWLAGAPVAAAQAPRPSGLQARAAIVMEASTGDVLFSKNSRDRRSIASATKLMTVLVALQRADLDDVFSATRYNAVTAESQIGLRAGERMSVRDLLRATLLPSANDAAATLAAGTMGSRKAFVAEMNRRAAALGLRDTHYTTPIGLDDAGNYSSARDLAKLAVTLRGYEFFRRTTDLPSATLRSGSRKRTVFNRNTLVRRVPVVNGVKTGHTNRAGYVLVGSATRDGVTVVSVVLGEPGERARDADSLALLRYGLDGYRVRHARARGPHARRRRAALPRRRRGRRRRRRDDPPRAAHPRAHERDRHAACRARSTGRCRAARGWGRRSSAPATRCSRACRS